MRLFKPKYKDKKTGKTKIVSKWWTELRDHLQIVRRFPAFTDKAQSKKFAEKIEKLVIHKQNNEPPDRELSQWLETVPAKLRDRFGEIGLLARPRAAAGKPLTEHIKDFRKSLQTRNVTAKHIRQTISRIKRIFEDCNCTTWSDVEPSRVNECIAEYRNPGTSCKTAYHYARTFRQFARWMVKERRASEVPQIESVKTSKSTERAFELDEFRRLLDAAQSGPVRFGMSGYERYTCYILAVETGLRRGELKSVTPASFDFRKNTVFVSGENTKNGEDAVQKLTERTSTLLQDWVRGKMPNVRLFNIHHRSAEMLQEDCAAAGIEVENNRGRLKFHSLRHTCGTFLADQGVHPKIIQSIMRHANISITMDRYCHTLKGQVAAAVAKMPDFSMPSIESQKATGTDGNDLASGLAFPHAEQCISSAAHCRANSIDDSKNRDSGSPRGKPTADNPAGYRLSAYLPDTRPQQPTREPRR